MCSPTLPCNIISDSCGSPSGEREFSLHMPSITDSETAVVEEAAKVRQPLPKAPPRRRTQASPTPAAPTSGPTFGRTILQLCGGPNSRKLSMFNLFNAAGMGCSNYDIANGPQCDLSDNITFAQIKREVSEGDFVCRAASPECGTFSKLHNLPGPPPLTSVSGPERYGIQA